MMDVSLSEDLWNTNRFEPQTVKEGKHLSFFLSIIFFLEKECDVLLHLNEAPCQIFLFYLFIYLFRYLIFFV